MGLIKSERAPTTLTNFSMADIEQQAHAIIVRAKNQAGRILAEAQRLGEEMKRDAHAGGLETGHREGTAKGQAEGHEAGMQSALDEHRAALSRLIESLKSATQQLDASRRLLEADSCTDVMRLAIAIARRVTRKLGEADASVVTENVREAMKLVISASDVRIAVNPSQKQTLEAVLPKLKIDWPTLEHVALIDDPSLDPGGCRIFTAGGQIDADLDEQINRIAADLIHQPA